MALCGQLEASLTATAATRRRLLDALLAEALAPAEERGWRRRDVVATISVQEFSAMADKICRAEFLTLYYAAPGIHKDWCDDDGGWNLFPELIAMCLDRQFKELLRTIASAI